MGIREDVLALADDVESTIGGCYGCLLDKRGLCKAETDFDCNDEVCKFVAHRLRAIAENDAESVTTVSAYDLLPEEDRKAIAWVREHGGLDSVEDAIKTNEWALSLAVIAHDALFGEDSERDTTPTEFKRELDRRLMPEGMEWPKVDGELVDFKTSYVPSLGVLEAVSIYNNGACEVMSHDGIVKNATEIHVFKPKVVDADGVEIHAGDVLYSVETGGSVTVDSIEPGNPWFATTDGALQHCAKFAHRAPVLAADGKPLKAGEAVWHVGNGVEFTVIGLPRSGEYQAVKLRLDDGAVTGLDPDQLTHEQPDTWERLEHDAEKTVCEYFGANYDCANCPLESARCAEEVKKDIIRRAKKLAEREQ